MEPLFFNRPPPLSICLWIPHCPSRPPYWYPERSQRTQEASNLPNPESFLLRWRLCTYKCQTTFSRLQVWGPEMLWTLTQSKPRAAAAKIAGNVSPARKQGLRYPGFSDFQKGDQLHVSNISLLHLPCIFVFMRHEVISIGISRICALPPGRHLTSKPG